MEDFIQRPCTKCNGMGSREVETEFLDTILMECEHCKGTGIEPKKTTTLGYLVAVAITFFLLNLHFKWITL